MSDASTHLTEDRMLALSGRAIQRIDLYGTRGTSLVTYEEIEAMATLLVCLGVATKCKEAFLKDHAATYQRRDVPGHKESSA